MRFIQGLVAFLIAQLFYSYAFSFVSWQIPNEIAIFLIVSGLVYTFTISYLLFKKNSKGYIIPIFLYQVVISLMAILAINYDYIGDSKSVAFGSIFFMISDSIICWHKFLFDVPFRDILVISTYYIAQGGIVYGIISK